MEKYITNEQRLYFPTQVTHALQLKIKQECDMG